MNAYLGELAALGTSLMFACSAAFFGVASRQIGSLALNRLRLVLAVVWLLLAHLLLRTPLPLHAAADRLMWLSISGILGLVIGDLFLFQAYIWIGPRLSMLMMALSPAIAALAAWLITGETLHRLQILGIGLTLAGIVWVVAERRVDPPQPGDKPGGHAGPPLPTAPVGDDLRVGPKRDQPVTPAPAADDYRHSAADDRRRYLYGILCGLGAAAGQALGLVTARMGLYGDFSALSGTLIRMVAAALVLWAITLVAGQAGPSMRLFIQHPPAVRMALAGAFFGPFAGVTLSLYAVQHSAIGVASTLSSLMPIIMLPIGYFFFRERFGWQAVAGTLLAMAGVVLLFVT